MKVHLPSRALALAGIAVVFCAAAPAQTATAVRQAATAVPQAAIAAPSAQTPTPAKLSVGDPAPALSLEAFVRGEPVAALEKGTAYLLHFWAPWNKASVEQFAALTELQKRLGEKGLVVIGIASADVTGTTIEKVRAKLVDLGDAAQFTIAWDKGTATKDAFLKAAGRSALPCAVFVDKEGKIAVVESAPLVIRFADAIVAGTHDYAEFAAWQTKAARAPQTARNLATAYQAAKWADVLNYADELLDVDPITFGGNAQAHMLAQMKLGQTAKAEEWAVTWVAGPGKDSPQGLNAVAWALVDPANPFPDPDLDLALKAAERATALSKESDGAILDTLARVHFRKGDVTKALELQKLALERLKPDQEQFRAQIQATLEEYEAAAKK